MNKRMKKATMILGSALIMATPVMATPVMEPIMCTQDELIKDGFKVSVYLGLF